MRRGFALYTSEEIGSMLRNVSPVKVRARTVGEAYKAVDVRMVISPGAKFSCLVCGRKSEGVIHRITYADGTVA